MTRTRRTSTASSAWDYSPGNSNTPSSSSHFPRWRSRRPGRWRRRWRRRRWRDAVYYRPRTGSSSSIHASSVGRGDRQHHRGRRSQSRRWLRRGRTMTALPPRRGASIPRPSIRRHWRHSRRRRSPTRPSSPSHPPSRRSSLPSRGLSESYKDTRIIDGGRTRDHFVNAMNNFMIHFDRMAVFIPSCHYEEAVDEEGCR